MSISRSSSLQLIVYDLQHPDRPSKGSPAKVSSTYMTSVPPEDPQRQMNAIVSDVKLLSGCEWEEWPTPESIECHTTITNVHRVAAYSLGKVNNTSIRRIEGIVAR